MTPTYRTIGDAHDDGWWRVARPTINHRGWLIIWEVKVGQARMYVRERSGHGPKGMKFRTISIPRDRRYPKARVIRIDEPITTIGCQTLHLIWATRIEDLLASERWARRMIDVRLDGRPNVDGDFSVIEE